MVTQQPYPGAMQGGYPGYGPPGQQVVYVCARPKVRNVHVPIAVLSVKSRASGTAAVAVSAAWRYVVACAWAAVWPTCATAWAIWTLANTYKCSLSLLCLRV